MIAQASPAAGPLQTDPTKRVNYTLGLVLGVDEFQQDQLYHSAGRQSHRRLEHGYGTVSGLAVGPVTQGVDPEIQVEAGVAVDPAGREIRVPDRMCVKVNRWLDRHQAALRDLYGDIPDEKIPVAVVLCHRECPTDTVPVPGEPCRSQDDAMQPSRIRESFELKLMLRDDAPWNTPLRVNPNDLGVYRLHHPEERAVRAFGELLARVQSTTDPLLGEHGRRELLLGVRALATAADEHELASPPLATDDPILLPAATAPDILRDAFRVWVTEVRPAIRAREDPGACNEDQCCVLLAEYDLPVTALWAVQAGTTPETAVKPVEERRPYLLHTRLLQEWLIAAGGEEGRPDVDSWATLQILGPRRIRMWVHHDAWLDVPREAVTVVLNDVPLPADLIATLVWAEVRNVWDVVLVNEMRDGDVVEIRFDTELIARVAAPPEPEHVGVREAVRTHAPRLRVKDALTRVVDAAERLAGAGDGGAEAAREREPGEETDEEMGDEDPVDRETGYGEWTPAGADRLEPLQTVADELRGPTGEYLDRYGWTLSAFTVYNRLQGGDLAGEYKLPIVAKIQRTPVSSTRPTDAEHYLRFDGAKWAPAFLDNAEMDLSGRYPRITVERIQGQAVEKKIPEELQYLYFDGEKWTPRMLPESADRSDLSGRYPLLKLERLQGRTLTAPDPQEHQVLTFHGTEWVPAAVAFDAEGSDLEGAAPNTRIARLQGNTVTAGDPEQHQVLTFDGSAWVPAAVAFDPAGSDLEGDAPNTRIARLQANPVDAGAPDANQVLSFDGTTWVAAAVAFDGETSDLAGDAPNTTIAKLQGNPVAAENPDAGALLSFDGTSWVPGTVGFSEASDLAGDAPNTTIAKLQGHPLAALGPEPGQFLSFDGTSWVPAAVDFSVDGDLTGSAPTTSIARLQGKTVDAQNPDDGQVLTWSGAAWVPAAVGFGEDSDLAGDAPHTTIARLQGQPVDAGSPAPNQVLTFNGSAWVAAAPPSGGGSGGGSPSGTAGGDLSGTYPGPSIGRLQGQTLDAQAPDQGQVLMFNGSAWVPAHPSGLPTGPAGGDLDGTYPSPDVRGLMGAPIAAGRGDRQVLFMRTEPRLGRLVEWVPGHVVEAPSGAYGIVAAGSYEVRNSPGDANPVAAPYGGLILKALGNQVWLLTGYPFDVRNFVYIVKGTAQDSPVLLANDPDFPDELRIRLPGVVGDNWAELHLEVSAYRRQAPESGRFPTDSLRKTDTSTSKEPAAAVAAPAPAAAGTAAAKKPAARTTKKP